jgi:protein-L-isoaspartate(D-aspartate) O-methyltransferase
MDTRMEAARRQMIDQQVRAGEVLDPRVLETFAVVPRERFVPEAYRAVAFADAPIPIGHGQFMLPPLLEGRMLQALAPARGERALEIGTGSGYFAACLAHLAGGVVSLEIHADLAAGAKQTLDALGIAGVSIETGDALARDYEPVYELIAVTGSLPAPEPRLEQALAIGGRMFLVMGEGPAMEACLVTRTGKASWLRNPLFETRIEPLMLNARPSRFRF